MKRREFLSAAGIAAAASLAPPAISSTSGRQLMNIGLQLYTVRALMQESVVSTLEQIAAIGYEEVEFAGYFDQSPADIRRILNDLGLTSPSTHVSLEQMRQHAAQTIDAAKTIGHDYIVLGWLPPHERETLDQYRGHAKLCNQFGEQCAEAGIQFGYHNHEFEYEATDGILPMDLLLAETDADLVKMELDLYWITYAGVDPLTYFEEHPGRFPLCHIKDMGADRKMADVGDGTIDFEFIFIQGEKAGFKHFFVERDDSSEPMTTARRSYKAASAIRI